MCNRVLLPRLQRRNTERHVWNRPMSIKKQSPTNVKCAHNSWKFKFWEPYDNDVMTWKILITGPLWGEYTITGRFFAQRPMMRSFLFSLQWRHNGRDSVSNHQPHHWLLNLLFRHRSKKTSKLRVTGLCVGKSPVTGEFPAHRASNAEMFPFDDVIMWWFETPLSCWHFIVKPKRQLSVLWMH